MNENPSSGLPILSLAIVCLALSSAFPAEPVPVFEGGADGYPVYRIPAILLAANGDLLAFCEARQGGDASETDLVLKRSSDSGKTWGPLELIQDSSDFLHLFDEQPKPPPVTVGNPCPVVDRLDPEHPGRIWLMFTVENNFVFVASSDDHGKTWSAPRDITSDVKLSTWGWYATGPCHAIQLQHPPHRGRLLFPADHRIGDTPEDKGACGMQVCYSDDHGKTWKLGAVDNSYDDSFEANETTVCELPDGRLYFSSRDQEGAAPGARGSVFSNDGGNSFVAANTPDSKVFHPDPELNIPVVQGSLLSATGPRRNLILFSGPTGDSRQNLSIRYSDDGAKTWKAGPLIQPGFAAYSDLVSLPQGDTGVLFETKSPGKRNYSRISFTTFSPADLP